MNLPLKALVCIAALGMIWALCCRNAPAALAWSCATLNALGWADLAEERNND